MKIKLSHPLYVKDLTVRTSFDHFFVWPFLYWLFVFLFFFRCLISINQLNNLSQLTTVHWIHSV